MRHTLSVSILALSLAMANAASAEEWFRLNLPSTVIFNGGSDETDGPPDHGESNAIEIDFEGDAAGRVYGRLTIPVSVSGIDETYAVSVINLPGAAWMGDSENYGSGHIDWPSATQGVHNSTVQVHDADGVLVAAAELEIVVYDLLEATVSEPVHEVEVGEVLTVVPTATNAIGAVQWGSLPNDLPDWLNFDASTGSITVDTSEANEFPEIVLTAVDQGDLASASTLPFSIAVNTAGTDYWLATLEGAMFSQGRSITSGADGSVYMVGQTTGDGFDFLLAKYDAAGALSWTKTLGGTSSDFGHGVAAGADGSIYVTGFGVAAGTGSRDVLVAKYSSSGELVWQKALGSSNIDQGSGVTVGPDGSIYVTGYATNVGAGGSDLLVAKYTANGDLSWTRTLGGATLDFGYGISVDSDGSIYVAGVTASVGAGGNDLLIAKYTSSGALSWHKTLGGSGSDVGQAISIGTDGSLYVTGMTASAGAGGQDLLVAKYTSAGELSWKKTLGGTAGDNGQSIAAGADGAVYVAGGTSSAGAGSSDALVAKYSTSGELLWQKTLGGASGEGGYGIAVGLDDSIYLTGHTVAGALVARLPSDGEDDLTAGSFTWAEAALAANSDPNLTHGSTPSLIDNANPSLTDDASPALVSTDVASFSSTATPLVAD